VPGPLEPNDPNLDSNGTNNGGVDMADALASSDPDSLSAPVCRGPAETTAGPRLNRVVLNTSWPLDFIGQRELAARIGHGVEQWPLVVLKEFVDNALDAAEGGWASARDHHQRDD
jgi:hypothetical protein